MPFILLVPYVSPASCPQSCLPSAPLLAPLEPGAWPRALLSPADFSGGYDALPRPRVSEVARQHAARAAVCVIRAALGDSSPLLPAQPCMIAPLIRCNTLCLSQSDVGVSRTFLNDFCELDDVRHIGV